MLDIVNERDEIIGSDTRENIHKNALLHREINVWLFNDNNEVILEKRSPLKDTCPNLLNVSAGGHVEQGDNYENTAIKELEEETGIKIEIKDLIFIDKIRINETDQSSGMIDNAFQAIYAYRYNDDLDNLVLEQGNSIGFELWSLEKMLDLSDEEKKNFVPSIVQDYYKNIYKNILELNK